MPQETTFFYPIGEKCGLANGKRWGGSQKGRRITVTTEQVETIRQLKAKGLKVAAIARATGLSRPTTIMGAMDANNSIAAHALISDPPASMTMRKWLSTWFLAKRPEYSWKVVPG
jgi:hypothetical protein